ncbi:MAG: sigma-70 family RNA polymerase sigma factor [Planctomycetota bacterium]|nr:sigma-70 family RNA polymerase sigma factor [Planctomycetota bacterium]
MPDAEIREQSDAALMGELAQGNHYAFDELMRRYQNALVTFCYGFTRDRETAEELTQEAFLRVYRNASRYEPVAKFTTWLYKIAANLCINELKKRKLRPNISLDDTSGHDPEGTKIIERMAFEGDAPVTEAEKNEAQALIQRAIDSLPDDQRSTLILVEYHHMAYQDIAEVLGVTVSAIKMRVKRARETLRHSLRILQEDVR